MALNNDNSAARLLDQLRSQFAGDALPGDPFMGKPRSTHTQVSASTGIPV
jgi:hypothetical protein